MTVFDGLAAVKEAAEHMNKVGVAGKLRSPGHTVTVVPCVFESADDFQQSSLLFCLLVCHVGLPVLPDAYDESEVSGKVNSGWALQPPEGLLYNWDR